MAKKSKTPEAPKSTAQQLGAIVKSCRDIMRKDKGLNGDIDRLPMLTWIMFLKFLDDMERVREEEQSLPASVSGQASRRRTAGAIGRQRKRGSPARSS